MTEKIMYINEGLAKYILVDLSKVQLQIEECDLHVDPS